MSFDIEKEAERLLAKIKKTIPKNADKNPASLAAFNLARDLPHPLEYHLPLNEVPFSTQDERMVCFEKEYEEADEERKDELLSVLDFARKMIIMESEESLTELAHLRSVLVTYVREHNVQETEPLWKVNETLLQCVQLAWVTFNETKDLDFFMSQVQDILKACKRIVPAIVQSEKDDDLHKKVTDLHKMEKEKTKKRSEAAKKGRKESGLNKADLLKRERLEKACQVCHKIISSGTKRNGNYRGPYFYKGERFHKQDEVFIYVVGHFGELCGERDKTGKFQGKLEMQWTALKQAYKDWKKRKKIKV